MFEELKGWRWLQETDQSHVMDPYSELFDRCE